MSFMGRGRDRVQEFQVERLGRRAGLRGAVRFETRGGGERIAAAGPIEEEGDAGDEQRARQPVGYGGEHRVEIGSERGCDRFDQRLAVVEARAVEDAIDASLYGRSAVEELSVMMMVAMSSQAPKLGRFLWISSAAIATAPKYRPMREAVASV